MAWPFSRRPKVIGSTDPRAMYAARYRYPDDQLGGEIRIGNTRPKFIIGGNSSGKTSGIISVNALKRTGVSQYFVDTRCQQGAISAPWRRTVDEQVLISNEYGSLTQLPDYQDLKSTNGINLLEASELDPDSPLVFDHLNIMAETAFPTDNAGETYFDLAAQSLDVAFTWGELREAKQQGRRPLKANVRWKILERSEFNQQTGEPIKGLAKNVQDLMAFNNPIVNSSIARFGGVVNDEILSVVSTYEAKSRWMMSPMLSEAEKRGGIDFTAPGRRVSSTYLAVPSEHVDGCSTWLRLGISGALRPLFAPHAIPVTFWLDEYYALKRIPIIENSLGVVAGSKIEIIFVIQSLAMLAHLHSKVWEAFLGQAGAIILVGPPGDKFTADYLSARSGETTIVQPHANWSMNTAGYSLNGGDAYTRRPHLMPGDLYDLKPATGFVWVAGMANPIPAAFPGYYTDPVLSRRARRDPYVRW